MCIVVRAVVPGASGVHRTSSSPTCLPGNLSFHSHSTQLEKEKWIRDLNATIQVASDGGAAHLSLPIGTTWPPPQGEQEMAAKASHWNVSGTSGKGFSLEFVLCLTAPADSPHLGHPGLRTKFSPGRSDEVSLEQEAQQDTFGAHGAQALADSMAHVCWSRNTSISRVDRRTAVQVDSPPSPPTAPARTTQLSSFVPGASPGPPALYLEAHLSCWVLLPTAQKPCWAGNTG